MNDTEFEEALKNAVRVCYGDDNDLIRRGDALNVIRETCRIGHLPSSALTRREQREVILLDVLQAVRTVKKVVTSLQSNWKNAKTEPPPPNTDVEVYCKALGVTVGYHRPLTDEWLTDDHRTLRNVTHWRPIPPPPEAEP